MTWSTWDARRQVRVAAVAAGLVGTLVLTACGGDGGSDDEPSTGPGTSASASADTGGAGGSGGSTGAPGGSGGSTGAPGGLQGSWLATTGGKAVVLMINAGRAGLFATGGTMCSGTASELSDIRRIRLTCTNGNKDRATGVVDSVTGSTLKVTWKSGLGTETYTRSEGGSLPTGLPTATPGS